MRRGTRVGQAYVALAVDGSKVNDDIVDSLDNINYRGLGEKYASQVREGFQRDAKRKGLFTLKGTGDRYFGDLQKHLEKNLSSALTRSLESMEKAFDTDDTMRQSVKRMVSRVEKDGSLDILYKRIAREAGVEFDETFGDTVKNTVHDGLRKSLLNAARSGKSEKDLIRSLVKSIGLDGGKGSMLLPGLSVEGMAADLRKELEKAANEWKSMLDEAHKMNQRFNEERIKEQEETLQRMLLAQERMLAEEAKAKAKADVEAAKSDKERLAARKRLIAETLRVVETRAKEEEKILDRISVLSKKFTEQGGESRKKVEREVALAAKLGAEERIEAYKRIHETAEEYYTDLTAWRKEQERLSKEAIRAARAEGRVSRNTRDRDRGPFAPAAVGAFFGAGARNNFLNLMGRTIGNTLKLVDNLGKGFTSLVTTFTKGAASVSEGASSMTKMMGGFGAVGTRAISAVTAALPAMAISFVVVTGVMSAMISVASALTALLVALASTVVSGLTGALLVLGGAMSAVVAAGGLLVAAFTAMDDAQKKVLKESFRPLRAAFVGLGQIMLKDLVPAFSTWSTNLQRALHLAAPVAQVMGQAFAQAGNIITAAFSGPGFQRFAESLAVYLPSIVTNLSRAFGNFMNGLMGMFAAIMPYVNQFAAYLSRVTERFSNWANSASGQNSIVNFVGRALESLKSLWNFTREFFGWLFDLLFSPAAQEAGNSLFDSMAKSFEGFRRAIANGDLERWFQTAIQFGGDLKQVIIGVKDVFVALNNSGVLAMVGSAFRFIGNAMSLVADIMKPLMHLWSTEMKIKGAILMGVVEGLIWVFQKLWQAVKWAFDLFVSFGRFVLDVNGILGPLEAVVSKLGWVADAARTAADWLNKIPGVNLGGGGGDFKWGVGGDANNVLPQMGRLQGPTLSESLAVRTPTIPDLVGAGNRAISRTNLGGGGGGGAGGGAGRGYVNPYTNWANSLIKQAPSIQKQIRKALNKVNKEIRKTLAEAADAENKKASRTIIKSLQKSLRGTGRDLVQTARSELNSAAQSLAGASSPKAAAAALRQVRKAQEGLRKAQRAQNQLQKAARKLARQRTVNPRRVSRLMDGLNVQNATMAEYATARARVARRLEKANDQLAAAIEMRDSFRQSVIDSVREFGSFLTAEAKVVDGVEQALTGEDITQNLQERLEKIRTFRSNLQLLIAQGLSDDAYKQLLDAGVEQGGAYAQALVDGGLGSITELNSLVDSVNSIADELGLETSNRLYQAGVNAAQGLVDGLESLSAKLDNAADRLGKRIAKALKKSLKIKSPSQVLISMMDDVGDGAVVGLDNQHVKVGRASERLSEQIAVSPEVARWAAAQAAASANSATEEVSGNGSGQKFRDLIVHTPTQNPEAVAMEVLNEVTGRL